MRVDPGSWSSRGCLLGIINVMWSGGSPYSSVHTVHQQILAQAAPGTEIKTWLLQDKSAKSLYGESQVKAWGWSSKQLKGRGIWALAYFWLRWKFGQALVKDKAQLVLLDGLGVARVLLPVLRTLRHVRVVVVFHGATRLREKDRNLLREFSSEQLTLCAVSQTLSSSIGSDTQLPVVTLRYALDLVTFKPRLLPRDQAREQLGIAVQATQVFGAVGRLVAGKGFDCLINAFAQALKKTPDMLLMIIGEGRARSEMESRIEVLSLQGKVLLPGHIDNVTCLYRAFDWVLIPSREEGLGLIVQEAVVAGVPVLSSDLAVFHEQLGDSGCYVPVGDVSAWGKAIESASTVCGAKMAERQYASLAPEQSWQRFSQACSEVLLISE